jgi:hypothetical protein
MSDAAPSGRHGRRARQLLQRYLVAFGPLHGIARSGVALDQLIIDFFAGRVPSPEGVAASRQLTAALTADAAAATPAPSDTVWGRFDRLCTRLALPPVELDALLLLIAPRFDGGTRWLARAVLGDEAWTADRLCSVLDPFAVTEPAWAAAAPSSLLIQLGLVIADGEQRHPAQALLAHLGGMDADLAASFAGNAHRGDASPASRVLAGDALHGVRIVDTDARTVAAASGVERSLPVVARGSHGDRDLATQACHRRGAGLVELSAAALDAADLCAVVIATAVRGRGVLVHGAPRGGTLLRLRDLGVPIVVQLARDTPLVVVDAVCRGLAAAVVDLPEPTLAARAAWWRAALAVPGVAPKAAIDRPDRSSARNLAATRTGGSALDPSALAAELAIEPLDRDDISRAVALAALSTAGDPRMALHGACRALAPSPLDALVDRVTPDGSLDTSAAADTIAALRAELARRAEPAVVFVEAGTQPVAPIAALIARELGLRLYEVTAERALAQPEPLARWLARVLAAAAATPAALVLPDLSTLVASDGGELLLPLLRAHRGIAFAHARERALFSGAP